MGLHVTLHRASGLNHGRALYSHVVVKHQGAEAATQVCKDKSAAPQWEEAVLLEGGEEEGASPRDASEVSVEVYGGDGKDARQQKLIATAVLHVTDDAHGQATLALRQPTAPLPAHATPPGTPVRSPPAAARVEAGELTLSWEVRVVETAFKASLVRLITASEAFVEPLLWGASLLTWERPYQTGFFLTLFTYTCWYAQYDLIIPVVVAAILLNSYVRHFRYGPPRAIRGSERGVASGGKLFGLRLFSKEQKLPAEVEDRVCARHDVLRAALTCLDLAHDVLAVGSPEGLKVAGVAPGLPAPGAKARRATRKAAIQLRKRLVHGLLFWTAAEVFGLCPPLGVLVVALVWGVFVWYPLQQSFPTIRTAARNFFFQEDAAAAAAGGGGESGRIFYSPKPAKRTPVDAHLGVPARKKPAAPSTSASTRAATSSASASLSTCSPHGLTYESLGATTSDMSGLDSSLPSPATTPPFSPASGTPVDDAPRAAFPEGPAPISSPATDAIPAPAWRLAYADVTTHEERGGVTYFRVQANLTDGTSKVTWHRYSQFRNLRSYAMEHSQRVRDIHFPGKTFGKCDGASLAARESELNTFVGELRKIAASNAKVRDELGKFLGVAN